MAAQGWALLEKAGVPRGAWFVALHVRDIRWRGTTAGLQAIRNADTASYLPAIDEITRRGGFVIRMGDAEAPPLPPLANVIDYGRSDMRSDWMDIFLLAAQPFRPGIGVRADLRSAALWRAVRADELVAAGHAALARTDIYIPKLAKRAADGTYLTLSETLREPVSYCHSLRHLARAARPRGRGQRSGAIIHDAVAEMLTRLDAGASSDADVEDLRARADRIYQSHGHFGMARLSRGFLRRYRDLIT